MNEWLRDGSKPVVCDVLSEKLIKEEPMIWTNISSPLLDRSYSGFGSAGWWRHRAGGRGEGGDLSLSYSTPLSDEGTAPTSDQAQM